MTTSAVILRRTVRFAVGGAADAGPQGSPEDRNGFAGRPSMLGAGVHVELDVACRCSVDRRTGYSINIKVIDGAVRTACLPIMVRGLSPAGSVEPGRILRQLMDPLNAELRGKLEGVRWYLTPYYSLEMTMTDAKEGRALLRQQFEFAAAHRLHVPELSDAENRAVFGKCNNPRGHGHNYRVEPCVEVEINDRGAPSFTLQDLERLTMTSVIDRFDHTHLNEDTVEFASGAGLNPSVENIARVCFELLSASIAERGGGARLKSMTVWETDKTSCTYPA